MAGLKGTIYIKNKFSNTFLQPKISIKLDLNHMQMWTASQIVCGIAQFDQISLFSLYKCTANMIGWLISKQQWYLFGVLSNTVRPTDAIRVSFICSIRVRGRPQINEKYFSSISVLYCWRWPVPLEWLWSYWPVPWSSSSNYTHSEYAIRKKAMLLRFSCSWFQFVVAFHGCVILYVLDIPDDCITTIHTGFILWQ